MRWRTREEPIGSHQLEARAEKWESSFAETEEWVRREWREREKEVERCLVRGRRRAMLADGCASGSCSLVYLRLC